MSTPLRRLGQYELLHTIGKGNVGEVWKARDLANHRDVALKLFFADIQRSEPHFLTRLSNEGQALSALQHPNIVRVHEVKVTRLEQSQETVAYLVMDLVEGLTLIEYIRATAQKGLFPGLADLVYLFTSLGVAIDYAHQRGVVHGDLKPSNVLLNKRENERFKAGEPMLSDFALAQITGQFSAQSMPLYLSPEQAQGFPASQRSDVYSLGVMLYELVTGIVPFRDESSVAVMMQHIHRLPTPPILINSNIPPALSEVILRAMAKDPITRFPMASLLAAAIADACSQQSTLYIGEHIPTEEEKIISQHTPAILGVVQPPSIPPFSQPRLPAAQPSQPVQEKQRSQPLRSSPGNPISLPGGLASLPSTPRPSGLSPTSLSGLEKTITPTNASPAPQPSVEDKGRQFAARPQISLHPSAPEQPASSSTPKSGSQSMSQTSKPSVPAPVTSPGSTTSRPLSLPSSRQPGSLPPSQIPDTPAIPVRPDPFSQPSRNPAPSQNRDAAVNPSYSAYPSMPPGTPASMPPASGSPSYAQQAANASEYRAPVQATPVQPVSSPSFVGRVQRLGKQSPGYLVMAVLAIILLIGGGIAGIGLLTPHDQNPTPAVTHKTVIGNVFFQSDGLGQNDQLQINMQKIAAPPVGKAYMVWQEDTNQQFHLLGTLPALQNGRANLTYPGDNNHTNLLSNTRSVFLTLEDQGSNPTQPAPKKAYRATFDNAALPYLKNILYQTPDVPGNQSVTAALLNTIGSLNDKATSINDSLSQDPGLVIRQASRIIDMVDGADYAAKSGDRPANIPNLVDAKIGLLSAPDKPGYIDLLDKQLDQLKKVSANDQERLKHIQNAKYALDDLRDWLQKIRTYDVKILKAADLHDQAIIGVALQLKQAAADSYTGHTIPPDTAPQPKPGSAGAYQAYTEAQYLAMLDFEASS